MSDRTMPPVAATVAPARLEPDAISVAQDTLIGLADTGPTVSVSFTLVALIAATAYGAPLILLITAIPMLIIANAYRRLNLWNANCGASFEWVGRADRPHEHVNCPGEPGLLASEEPNRDGRGVQPSAGRTLCDRNGHSQRRHAERCLSATSVDAR